MIKILINTNIASKEEIKMILDMFEITMIYNSGGVIL